MKYFAILFALVCGTAVSYSQSLAVVGFQQEYSIKADGKWFEDMYGTIRNASSASVPTRLRIDKSGLLDGHHIKFCFALECYPEEVSVSSNTKAGTSNLAPMASDSSFHGGFMAESTEGTSVATLNFFNNSKPTDVLQVVITVHATSASTGVAEDLSTQFSVAPNPASDRLQFNLPNPSRSSRTIRIVDINGNEVQRVDFNADGITFDSSNLPDGSYAAIVNAANGAYAQIRFVVMH